MGWEKVFIEEIYLFFITREIQVMYARWLGRAALFSWFMCVYCRLEGGWPLCTVRHKVIERSIQLTGIALVGFSLIDKLIFIRETMR